MSNDLALIPPAQPMPADPLDLFARFLRLDVASGDASPCTIKAYKSHVAQFAAWCTEQGIAPAAATESDLKQFRQYLIGRYARKSTALKLASVRRFFQAAVANGLRADNPAAGLKAPRDLTNASESRKWLGLADLQRLLAAPDRSTLLGKRDAAMMALFLMCGPRLSEVAGLNLGDVDLERGEIRVLGKGRKARTLLPEGEQVLGPFRDWLAARDAVAAPGETAVFVSVVPGSRQGHRLTGRAIETRVDGYLVSIGAKRPGVSVHALRHSFATWSLSSGARLIDLSAYMGHSSTTVTEVYAQIVNKRLGNPTRFLAGMLAQAV